MRAHQRRRQAAITHVPVILSSLWRFGVVAASTVLAALLAWVLSPWIATAPLLLFLASVAFSAWSGGLWPGVVATLLGVVGVAYFFARSPVLGAFGGLSTALDLAIFGAVRFWRRDEAGGVPIPIGRAFAGTTTGLATLDGDHTGVDGPQTILADYIDAAGNACRSSPDPAGALPAGACGPPCL